MSPKLKLRPEWQALQGHFGEIGLRDLCTLFAADTRRLLCERAKACAPPLQIAPMCRGDPINTTKHRAALHIALRAPADERIVVNGCDVIADAHKEIAKAFGGDSGDVRTEGSRPLPKLAHDSSTHALIRRYRHLRDASGPER